MSAQCSGDFHLEGRSDTECSQCKAWCCFACTLINKGHHYKCKACGTKRPQSQEWKCHMCTLDNPGHRHSCRACGARLQSTHSTWRPTRNVHSGREGDSLLSSFNTEGAGALQNVAGPGLPHARNIKEQWRVLVMGSDQKMQKNVVSFLLQCEKGCDNNDSFCSHVDSGIVGKTEITVINAIGILDGNLSEDELERALQRLYFQAAPGPHVLLYVSKLFERELDRDIYRRIVAIFGKELVARAIFVFQEFEEMAVADFSQSMRKLGQFRQKVHISSSMTADEHASLLEKISEVIKQHDGTYFMNEVLKEAERCLQEHTKVLLSKTHAGKELEKLKQELIQMKVTREEDKKKIEELEEKILQAKAANDETEANLRKTEQRNLLDDETLHRFYRGLAYVSEKLILTGIISVVRSYFGF